MKIFTLEYWDAVNWVWMEARILAETPEAAIAKAVASSQNGNERGSQLYISPPPRYRVSEPELPEATPLEKLIKVTDEVDIGELPAIMSIRRSWHEGYSVPNQG